MHPGWREPESGADASQSALSAAAASALDVSMETLDLLPGAVAITDGSGAVVAANGRFETGFAADGRPRTCCDLVGCAQPGGPVDGDCITRVVLRTGDPWSGSIAVPGRQQAVAVTASRLHDTENRVVLHLSDEPSGDAAGGPLVRIRCLGRTRVEAGHLAGTPDGWLGQRPGTLLKYLVATRDRAVTADDIVEALWPHGATADPGTVRHLVHQLRRRLDPRPDAGASLLVTHHRGYRLDRSAVWIDADAYEAAVRAGILAATSGDRAGAERELMRALDLYGGEFLADEQYAEWALAERERLHDLVEGPLRLLAQMRIDDGDFDGAAVFTGRLADLEPFDADVQRLAIEVWLRQGRHSRAARHYDVYRTRLWREFRDEPPFELSDVASAVARRRRG